MVMRRRFGWKGALAAIALAGVALVGTASTASAYDDKPCDRPQVYRAGHWVQYCPLWRGNVPVLASPQAGAPQVGVLVNGGTSNWFVGDKIAGDYSLGSYRNNWWAFTMADNGRWGWVSEVYFSGGQNYDPDSGLYLCGSAAAPHTPNCS